MTKKATLVDVSSGYASGMTLDKNYKALNDKFDNTLSRDGSTPNDMEADLDMGDNDIINVNQGTFKTIRLGGVQVTDLVSRPEWKGVWTTSTAYVKDNLVRQDGTTYICIVDHTSHSSTFSTDLTSQYWEVFTSRGASGSGSGDLVASVNLADVDDPVASLANLGGQPLDSTLTSLSGASQEVIDYLQATTVPAQKAALGTSRRWIDLQDYVDSDDTLDCHTGFQAALDAAEGKELVITNRTYRFLNRADGSLNLPKNIRMIWEDNALLDVSAWDKTGTTSEEFLKGVGTWQAAITLTSDISSGDRTITLGSGQGASFSAGDVAYISTDELFTIDDGSLGTKGEWLWIGSVSGDVLTLVNPVQDNYIATGNSLSLHLEDELQNVILDNPRMLGCGMFTGTPSVGDRGIVVGNAKKFIVNGGEIKDFDFMNVFGATVASGFIQGLTSVHSEVPATDINQYGITLANGSFQFTVRDSLVLGGKEGVCLTTTGPSFGLQGVTRGVSIDGNTIKGQWRSCIATHDNHEDLVIANNVLQDAEQGIDIRIRGFTIANNIIKDMGSFAGNLNCGIQLASGSGRGMIHGNMFHRMLRGIWMPDAIDHERVPGDYDIENNKMRDIGSFGILLDFRGGTNVLSSTALGYLNIKNLNVQLTGTGAPRGVEAQGRWTNPYIEVTVDCTDTDSRAVYLHATNNGASTNGPINPEIHARYTVDVQDPLVVSASGVTKVFNRGIGHTATGE